jgi:hypothetical protein
MRNGSYAAIGFAELGDLSSIALGDQVKEAVRHLFEEKYPGTHKPLAARLVRFATSLHAWKTETSLSPQMGNKYSVLAARMVPISLRKSNRPEHPTDAQ